MEMNLIYDGRKYKVYSRVKLPKNFLDTDEKGYLYFIRIGKEVYKIGTACNILRRMVQHCKYYEDEIYILWISPKLSKYTTLRVEEKMKRLWKTFDDWEYKDKDRFFIPAQTERITIKIKKEYEFVLE